MKSCFLLALLVFISSTESFSASKYALLVGINKYYKKENGKIVLDSANTLHGCVNDAMAMKGLMVKRFGFKNEEIKELYDSLATKHEILKEINDLLTRCDSGDVAVVYYSGHGMTFPYGPNAAQTAEALCPSDIFTSVNFFKDDSYEYSFLETSELAVLFNKFVDKKVALTAIFDCCYSNGTIGFKKTTSTKTLVNGIEMIREEAFWYEPSEMSRPPLSSNYRKYGLIEYGAHDQTASRICDPKRKEEAIRDWLSTYGYAGARDLCSGKQVSWTNDYSPSKWKTSCGAAGSVTVTFSARDSCGHKDTTSATFSLIDTTKPEIVIPARDTIVPCCGPGNRVALMDWLKRNGGCLMKDGCSALSWSNDFAQYKGDLDSSGTVLIKFTAKDACGNQNTTYATFSIEDNKNPLEYRLSAQESRAIIDLLNNLEQLKKKVNDYGFFTNAWLRDPILYHLNKMDTLKVKVKEKTKYEATGSLESIQGTPLMDELLKNTDSLLVLFSYIQYGEEFRFVDWNVTASASKNEQHIIEPDRNTAYKEIRFKDFNALKNAVDSADFTHGFPYKKFDFNPPSQVPGSRFVFISASNDKEKAIETTDKNGIRHGIFTSTLVELLDNKKADMNTSQVFDKILEQFKEKKVVQTPVLRAAESRKQQTLFGEELIQKGSCHKCHKK